MADGLKIPVIQRPNYTVYFEGIQLPNGGVMVFVHCDVAKWSKTVKTSLFRDFALLAELRKEPLYCFRHDKKQQKFIEIFGFEYAYSLPEHNLDIYQLEI